MPKPRNRHWTDEEAELLKTLWNDRKLTSQDIYDVLDRTRGSVTKKIDMLGLERRTFLESKWKMEETLKRYKEVVEG
ncbi:unnamed protein product [marine sediment metagenome]|uniref:Myb-like domain-containing protein n=1 Tax=marine sediment metagenome TaxID=412755 RepID=X0VV32_9ZZZZ